VAVSLGIHESQSRMWENMVGRSLPFWKHYMPKMQKAFPSLNKVSLEDWYKAINMVQPSFIRVEADEVTYNLHILLRFELEQEMMTGKVAPSEIPAVWNERTEKYFGITPHNDLEGCLQDVHWAFGLIGYFPTYTLGNLLAAQLYYKAQKDIKDMEGGFAKGQFKPFLGWLRKNIHENGRKYMFLDTCQKVTGKPLDEENLLRYIKEKYGPLFGVKF
jgi:carboxypeptidase Taq